MKKVISTLSSLCLAATSLFGAFSAIPASAAATAANPIVYDLVLNGKTAGTAASSDGGYNVYGDLTAGSTITIDWVVKNDPGTAGFSAYLDFSALTKTGGEYLGSTQGDAYDKEEPIKTNDHISKDGVFEYGFGLPYEMEPVSDKVIYSFNFKLKYFLETKWF